VKVEERNGKLPEITFASRRISAKRNSKSNNKKSKTGLKHIPTVSFVRKGELPCFLVHIKNNCYKFIFK